MRVLIDTNILLDFLLEREPFFEDAERLFQAIGFGSIVGYVTATTITDVFYIARKQTRSVEQARQAVSIILTVMQICPVDIAILQLALTSNIKDFEDAVQVACAISQQLDAIITRDTQDFANAAIPVLSVSNLLARLT